MRKKRTHPILVVVAVAMVSSCSKGAQDQQRPSLGATPRPTVAGAIKAPLDSYLPGRRDETYIAKAKDILARSCLNKYGVNIDRPILADRLHVLGQIRASADSFFSPVEEARKFGFDRPGDSDDSSDSGSGEAGHDHGEPGHHHEGGESEDDAIDANVTALLNGWHQRGRAPGQVMDEPIKKYKGIPVAKFGCLGEAEVALSDGVERPIPGDNPGGELDALNYVQRIRWEASQALASDERIGKVTEEWRECLRAATGLKYRNPYALVRDSRWSGKTSKEEIKAAVANSRCQLKVNFIGLTEALEAKYQQIAEDENKTKLEAVGDFFEYRAGKAKRIAESSGK